MPVFNFTRDFIYWHGRNANTRYRAGSSPRIPRHIGEAARVEDCGDWASGQASSATATAAPGGDD